MYEDNTKRRESEGIVIKMTELGQVLDEGSIFTPWERNQAVLDLQGLIWCLKEPAYGPFCRDGVKRLDNLVGGVNFVYRRMRDKVYSTISAKADMLQVQDDLLRALEDHSPWGVSLVSLAESLGLPPEYLWWVIYGNASKSPQSKLAKMMDIYHNFFCHPTRYPYVIDIQVEGFRSNNHLLEHPKTTYIYRRVGSGDRLPIVYSEIDLYTVLS